MFFRKKSIAKIFDSHLLVAYRLLKTSGGDNWKSMSLDLEPLIYVISDLAVMYANKDRNKVSNEVLDCIFTKYQNCSDFQAAKNRFLSRTDFYTEVINGKPLHGHCMSGMHSKIENNAIMRCAVAFTDCLQNPSYIDDYEGAPEPMFDIFTSLTLFEKFTVPLSHELLSFAKDIQKAAK